MSVPTSDSTGKRLSPRLGAHMSIAGGLHNAFDIAQTAGCDCLQVFVKNQRQWNAKPLGDDAVDAWRGAASRTGIGPTVAHATYLINLASPNKTVRTRSIAALAYELERCSALGIRGLVMHPGAHLGEGEAAGVRRIARSLDEVLARTAACDSQVWLEITAGQGSCLGHRFEHLRDIIAAVRDADRVGVCFDTCHACAAGYRMDTPEGYDSTFAQFDACIGPDRLRCFHMNDSKRELGSRVDRHTHIGKGPGSVPTNHQRRPLPRCADDSRDAQGQGRSRTRLRSPESRGPAPPGGAIRTARSNHADDD